MKAVQIFETGSSDTLKYSIDVEKPPVKRGHVIVKNHAIGVNFIDIYMRTGFYSAGQMPAILGMEAAGEIVEIGLDTPSNLTKGDRVAYVSPGSYAEYSLVPALSLVPIPDGISYDDAAAVLLQGLTAMCLVNLSFKVDSASTVLIPAAAGGMGTMLTQMCKNLGAIVIGTTSTLEKAEMAKQNGCDHVLLYKQEDVAARVLELTNGAGADAAFDGIGKATFDSSISSLGYMGSMISFGNASGPIEDVSFLRTNRKCVYLQRAALFGFLHPLAEKRGGGPSILQKYSNEIFEQLKQKKIKLLIYKKYPLSKVAEAHQHLESAKSVGKILLDPAC